MKKFSLFILLTMLAMVSRADVVVADSSDCRLTIKVLPTEDVTKIPIQVSMTNSVPMTCVQCYLSTPDTTDLFFYTGENRGVAFTPSDRWASQHHTMFSWGTKKHPFAMMALVVSTLSENFKGTDGPLFKVYFDGSKLADGSYSIKMQDANMVWTDRRKITTYLTPDAEAPFSIQDGKLVVE
ncbi:MAG: hypothetical protein J5678_00775 [Bacteroidaceae bacterium]|nr:hypothetical protein [Bacteroidaceae bacterium]